MGKSQPLALLDSRTRDGKVETPLEAIMAASHLEAVSPPRQRCAASNPHPPMCFHFISWSLTPPPTKEVILNSISLTGLLGGLPGALSTAPGMQ